MKGKMNRLDYEGSPFEIYEAVPDGEVKGGLIVVEEVWGLVDHIKDVADRYAREGYYVVSPELLSDLHIGKHAETLMLDMFNPEKRNDAQTKMRGLMSPMQEPDFGAKTVGKLKVVFDYLYAKSEVREWVAITGFCFGGSYSYALALAEPRLKAAVPFYGHSDVSDVDALHKIACPIQAFYGEKDERLMAGLPELKEAMKLAGVDFEAKVYSDCGHAFFNDTNPYAYNKAAAEDSWRRTLDFLAGTH